MEKAIEREHQLTVSTFATYEVAQPCQYSTPKVLFTGPTKFQASYTAERKFEIRSTTSATQRLPARPLPTLLEGPRPRYLTIKCKTSGVRWVAGRRCSPFVQDGLEMPCSVILHQERAEELDKLTKLAATVCYLRCAFG